MSLVEWIIALIIGFVIQCLVLYWIIRAGVQKGMQWFWLDLESSGRVDKWLKTISEGSAKRDD